MVFPFGLLCPGEYGAVINVSNHLFLIILLLFAAFGVDAAFSYKYNQLLGISRIDGLALPSALDL